LSNAIVSGEDYLKLPRAPETWLVENLLPTGGAMLLFGDPKVGKSYAALQLACCLTSGVDWLGFAVPRACKVVYVQLDTPRSLWAKRVEELAASGHPVEGVHFADRETLNTFPFDILNQEHFNRLTDALHELKPGAIILDTIRESHSGDENDSTAMQEVVARLDAAVKPASLILISHARKSNPEYGYDLMNDNRGSNYIVGRMDAICRFSKSSMRATSRTMEEHSQKLERQDDGTWLVAEDPFKSLAEMTVQNNPGASLRELARLLHEKCPAKSEDACRAFFRRSKMASK
jgi:RecA-family ATPase